MESDEKLETYEQNDNQPWYPLSINYYKECIKEFNKDTKYTLFSDNIDKIRQILGWKEIDLWGYKKEGKSSDAKQSNEQEQEKDY